MNTVVSHGHGVMVPNPLGHLRDLRDRGGRIVVIDPRRSESSHHADLHLAPRPGTDPAILAHLVREALRRGGDGDFLRACADEASLRRLAELVEPYDAERAAEIAGLVVDELRDLDALVAGAGRLSVETGTGRDDEPLRQPHRVARVGAARGDGQPRPAGRGTFNPGSLRRFEDAVPGGRGDLGPRPASRPDLRRLVNGEMPCAALADEIRAGHVKALLVRVGNPALAIAGQPALREALAGLDVLVAIDVRPTETTALATHVLPMTDHFERGDLLSGYLQAQPFLRWAPAVVARRGERRPQWWVFAELARRLGLPSYGSARRDTALAGRTVDDEAIAESIMGNARRPWPEVRAAPTASVTTRWRRAGWCRRGCRSGSTSPRPSSPPSSPPSHGAAVGEDAPLVLVNRRTAQQYNSLHRQIVGRGRPAVPSLLVHPADAATRGLASGDTATVSTAHGSCAAVVEVTDAIRAGVVSLPHGFDEANVNRLIPTTSADPLSGMTIVSGLPVDVQPSTPAANAAR